MNLIKASDTNETRKWQMSENYTQISAKFKKASKCQRI